ncbi:hypothetical protein [Mesorhizobium sp. M7A.F.Ca.MR.245.00.0.0]|uniref:hypothetical protein n=1 Tax=Mesorhizobium sp. M7A.F.Ca.MR.245.00.0.0 TaxID=2496778 RepID=UPI000FCC9D24|nr:hypothetical protein [Mesorhizobium sp. M7A.F.Ca.MR.245.00.0.0]RUV22789.1 hypothetical protein EOB80_05945 [Mesorhizobium sp. M7A.F.Ca.MR.245.00.0.0]RUV49420.1 hypothetical protein EOB77_19620 [Mesorhizobium sp. M7A.F.Ca.MR.228.00.0.0]
MVRFEMHKDGIVDLCLYPPHAATDEADYLEALERIGNLDGPYAIVVDIAGSTHLSREGEVRQAAWAKATRQRISSACRALALVRDNPNPRSRQSFERLWAIPVHVTSDREEARQFAAKHLDKAVRP